MHTAPLPARGAAIYLRHSVTPQCELSSARTEWLGRFGSAQLSTSPWRSDHLIALTTGVWRMASEDSVEDFLLWALALLAVEIHRVRELNDPRKPCRLPVGTQGEQVHHEPERPKSSLRAENRMYCSKNRTTVLESTGREWIEYTSTDWFPGLG